MYRYFLRNILWFLVLGFVLPLSAQDHHDINKAFQQQAVIEVDLVLNIKEPFKTGSKRLENEGKQAIKTARNQVLSSLNSADYRLIKQYQSIPAMSLTLNKQAYEQLSRHPMVAKINLPESGIGHLLESLPLAEFTDLQLLNINGSGRKLAVIDTGIDRDHPDFNGRIIDEYCYGRSSPDGDGLCPNGQISQTGFGSAEDDNGHGTNVTGIISADGDVSEQAPAHAADIIAIKSLAANNSFYSATDIAVAMDWLANNHADVDAVNMSLGTSLGFSGVCDNSTAWTQTLSMALENLRSNGTVVVVSSGNDSSSSTMQAPACLQNAMSVGAVYDGNWGTNPAFCTEAAVEDQPTCFSNSNVHTKIFAPGARITSSGRGGGLSTYYGTSQAAPHVAACAVLIRSQNPTLSVSEVEQSLLNTPTQVTDPKNNLDFPRLDCAYALSSIDKVFEDGFESL